MEPDKIPSLEEKTGEINESKGKEAGDSKMEVEDSFNDKCCVSEKKTITENQDKVKNKGTGAGGSNTNKNGLEYENQKDLSTEYDVIEKKSTHEKIVFKRYPDKTFITGRKSQFMKYLSNEENKDIPKCHGTKEPDCWFISENSNTIYIVELKFQQGGGSVCEKIQTCNYKIRNFKDRYPNKKIHYVYGLHEWFRDNCEGEIYYMNKDEIPHFWGDSEHFKQGIINYIINNL